MAAVFAEPPVEILSWLKTLPLAPEYYPTLSEFQDPIAYILKIEKEASKYGICKIIPPLPPPLKKTTIANLNRSLAARDPTYNPKYPPTFTTRQQQIGFCPRKSRPAKRPVWKSGERYTLHQFEVKAKQFEKTYLKKIGKKNLSALEIETLFWKASVDKPFSVEYANDMPGSAFVIVNEKKWKESGEATTVGETAWNMRGVSRSKGSLLRFMKEEIPGVTSPMVYMAMMFSWFAWHVEDHDLHSLNYLHMGAGKTWYGMPREAAVAFEEVVRMHGYGGEVNPLVTFAILGEKTTVMSPEVLIGAGIPCCRLVQNAGEFVVTFPRAYHSGFSHGFNCGEAANIATPEWLRVAKEAATRRASINYPPMVSHFQLLYALALTLCSRIPMSIASEPRSSRLKDKKRGEGETMIKELFVESVIQNNDILHDLLEEGSSCVLLPQNSSDTSICSSFRVGSHMKVKAGLSLGLCSPEEAPKGSKGLLSDSNMLDRSPWVRQLTGFCSANKGSGPMYDGKRLPLSSSKYSQSGNADICASTSEMQNTSSEKESTSQGDKFLDQGLFSCVTCGILSFACAAVIQPREAAIQYLMSADCSFFNNWMVDSGVTSDRYTEANTKANSEPNSYSGRMEKSDQDGLYDVPIQAGEYTVQMADQRVATVSNNESKKAISSLDLLAFAYGNSSDSDEEHSEAEIPVCSDENDSSDSPLPSSWNEHSTSTSGISSKNKIPSEGTGSSFHRDEYDCSVRFSSSIRASDKVYARKNSNWKERSQEILDGAFENDGGNRVFIDSNRLESKNREPMAISRRGTAGLTEVPENDVKMEGIESGHADYSTISHMQRSDDDSCRMHIFCLEHAVDVEKQLRPIGGVHMMLLCHPDYPKIEAEAKSLAAELGNNYLWNDIPFREATKDDQDKIQLALDDEEAVPGNRDWAVKLGINLYYSANLSRSPLYSKQMPFNSVIYKAFGRSSPGNSPTKPKASKKGSGKQKKIVVAGKWCGKVWMSNQVHPYLAQNDTQEQEHSISFRDEKLEIKENISSQTEELLLSIEKSPSRKPGRKRKKVVENVIVKKLKSSSQRDDPIEDLDDEKPESYSPVQSRRILRSGQTKNDTPYLHNDGKNIKQYDQSSREKIEGGPSSRLRKRPSKVTDEVDIKSIGSKKKAKKAKKAPASNKDLKTKDEEMEYQCDIEGCTMEFSSKQDLVLHKRNICPVKGCGKKFFSHKYLVQHRRVHLDDRPLKCPWKGCKMTFKWAWARTEHIRVHTGARPYVCREPGCNQTFRFVSDFSRHKRKTGHSVKSRG